MPEDHFSAVAAHYAESRPRYPAGLFDWLAAACGERRRLAWDCACGSGQATIDLASRFERVIATDASEAQVRSAPAHPRVQYRVAPAEASGIEGDAVDAVTVAQALHWFDARRFYAEADRVLHRGGVLAAWSYGVLDVGQEDVERLVAEFYRDTVGPFWPPERRVVERGYRDLPFPWAELEPPSLAIEVRWSLPQLAGYLRSWSATARYQRHHGVDPVAALEPRLAAAWRDPSQPLAVRWPLAIRAGRKP